MKAGEDEGGDTRVLTTRLRQEDDQRRRILCSRFLQKSTDFLRWIIAAVGGREELHCRTCALTAIVSRLKTTSGGFRRGREEVQLVVRGVQRPLRLEESEQSLGLYRTARTAARETFLAHTPLHGACENLDNWERGGGVTVQCTCSSRVFKNKADWR